MESSKDEGMMLMDLFSQPALGDKCISILDCNLMGCTRERCLCGCYSSVHFLTLLLGKGGFCLSLCPSPLSVPHLRCSSSQLGWGCSVCTSLFSEYQNHFRVWVALCPLQTEMFSAKPSWLSPLSARAAVDPCCCHLNPLSVDLFPWGCSWPITHDNSNLRPLRFTGAPGRQRNCSAGWKESE